MSVVAHEAARTYAGLAVALEQLHADLAAGRRVDAEAMGQLGDRLDRQARRMGAPKAASRPLSARERALAGRPAP
ncbi:hypothetical protein OPKNFCMD_5467 [Methylobacterium crusticola]|uniref:Uncharacterized protein n=1 Tax=Methylobacterium crusticola TaxID=1697972 RepID=A0ABQ4R7E7_9HYPH|nr:hypothetical protein [Methylobacterium crusticola]GJD52701.1 hypothetical protein OPKNFCMD_5467 [Methylobacterium crusticola]